MTFHPPFDTETYSASSVLVFAGATPSVKHETPRSYFDYYKIPYDHQNKNTF